MQSFAETELILTPEGRVYHINLKNEDVADDVILVGDQHRVAQISKHFDTIIFKTEHREFITHTGLYKGKKITVLSTGIGTDNIDIVLNELDAAVNINPITRTLNKKHRALNIIRLGTSGSLQANVLVNNIVASSHGLGLDGLLNFYEAWQTINENEISAEFIKQANWLPNLPFPYCVAANINLLNKAKSIAHIGITATAPGFYGPQGRQIKLKSSLPNLNDALTAFNFNNNRIINFEMETSALYGLGKLLGHNCLTLCVVIANRVTKEFTKDYKESVDILINKSLEKIIL